MRFVASAVGLALIGCDKDDPGGDGAYGALREAEITWLSDGAGPENTLPLEPMIIGSQTGNVGSTFRWTGTVDAGSDDLASRVIETESYGDGVDLLRHTRDGVVVYALDQPLAADAVPVLLVPDTVRVGMQWESAYGENAVNRHTVIAHIEVQLPIGPVSAWGIQEAVSEKVRWYGEGVGRIAGAGDMGADWNDEFAYTDFVLPAESVPNVELALDPVELRPVVDPFGHAIDLQAPLLLGVSSSLRDDGLWIYVQAFAPSTCPYCTDSREAYCLNLGPVPRLYGGGQHEACPLLEYEYNGDTYRYTIGSSASLLPGYAGAFPVDYLPLGVGQVPAEGGSNGYLLYTWNTPDGIQCLINGGLYGSVLYSQRGTDVVPCDRYDLTIDGAPQLLDDGAMNPGFYGLTLGGVQFVGPTHTASATAPLHLAAIDRTGRVFRLSVADGRIEGFVPVATIPGQRTMYVDDEQRVAYSITKDGRIFRVRVDADTGEVVVESLGDVKVADSTGKYTPIGVAPDPMHPGDVIVGVTAEPIDLGDGYYSVPIYPNALFRATLTREPVRLASPASFSVGVGRINGALQVCWQETEADFDPTGWLVGGAPALTVLGPVGANGNCALVVADAPAAGFEGVPHALTVNLPGAGLVQLAQATSPGYIASLQPETASVLRDGTFVDATGARYDENGMLVDFLYSEMLGFWARDIGGHGLWMHGGTWSATTVANFGGGIPRPDCGGRVCDYAGDVEGGGIMLSYRDVPQVDVIRPGGVERLPDGQIGTGFLLLADGRMCGLTYTNVAALVKQIQCTDPDGVVTTATGEITEYFPMKQMWPIPGGWLMRATLESGSYIFDPEAMTVEPLSERNLLRPVTAPDGAVYAISEWTPDQAYTPRAQIVQITAAGLVGIGPEVDGDGGSLTAFPIGDMLYVTGAGYADGTRIPR